MFQAPLSWHIELHSNYTRTLPKRSTAQFGVSGRARETDEIVTSTHGPLERLTLFFFFFFFTFAILLPMAKKKPKCLRKKNGLKKYVANFIVMARLVWGYLAIRHWHSQRTIGIRNLLCSFFFCAVSPNKKMPISQNTLSPNCERLPVAPVAPVDWLLQNRVIYGNHGRIHFEWWQNPETNVDQTDILLCVMRQKTISVLRHNLLIRSVLSREDQLCLINA